MSLMTKRRAAHCVVWGAYALVAGLVAMALGRWLA